MNAAVNKIILVGNLGSDPELRHTQKGNAVLNLSLATSRGVRGSAGDWKEETSWHRVTVWGKRAEICAKYLKKGNRVYVEGILKPATWVDKEGITHKSAEITVEEIKFLGGKSLVNRLEENSVPRMESPNENYAFAN